MVKSFNVISPVDGSIYVQRAFAANGQIDKRLDKAVKAFGSWKQTSMAERKKLCRKAVEWMLQHAPQLGEELTWQMGRPIQFASKEITGSFAERAEYMLEIAEDALADVSLHSGDATTRYIRRVPHGVVLVLAPWNYPYLTAVNTVIPALMAGNCVVLKHATQTPLCAEAFEKAFKAAGVPEGVLQAIHMDHNQVAGVVRDSRIHYVSFTGSVVGGTAIEAAMAGKFIGSGLELGGKDPAYVMKDANLEYAIAQLVDGSFFNSGQSCCGIERIYVDQRIFGDFVDGFVNLTNRYVLDRPDKEATTLGPVVSIKARQSIEQHIRQAMKGGAEALIHQANFGADQPGTAYLAPQVLVKVNHSMKIMTEETFGPVVGIMPIKSDKEAIELMNDSPYGLTASLWTSDPEKAQSLADHIDTGTVYMNRCDYLDPSLTWTGVKNSGRGCTLSSLGYHTLTHPKSHHLKKVH